MQTVLSDLRHAARRLKTSPAFTLVAVATLALGIAATTAIYSVVDALMLRPLPYTAASRLVDVGASTGAAVSGMPMGVTGERLAFWRGQTDLFERVEAYRTASFTLSGEGEPQQLIGAAMTDGLMEMLGIVPQAGRVIQPGDGVAGRERVIVISHTVWQTTFAAAPDIIGRAVRLDDTTYTVIGVMPAAFSFPYGRRQFWVPQVLDASPTKQPMRMTIIARLREGLTREAAQARAATLVPRLIEMKALQQGLGIGLTPPLGRSVNPPVRRALYVLAAAVTLVLLIACANLANLLLVQGAGRAREIAVRLALGASRGRLVQQLLTETVVLGALGGAVGLLLAQWTIDLLAAVTPREMTFLTTHTIALDGRVVAFAVVVTLLTSVIFGVLPALRGSRQRPNDALKDGRTATGAPKQERLRRVFVLGQVALSLVLLIGAGLMTRTFTHLTRIDPGFDPRGVVGVDLQLPSWKYGTRELQTQFFDQLAMRVRALPQVRSTTLTGGGAAGRRRHQLRAPVRDRRSRASSSTIRTCCCRSPKWMATISRQWGFRSKPGGPSTRRTHPSHRASSCLVRRWHAACGRTATRSAGGSGSTAAGPGSQWSVWSVMSISSAPISRAGSSPSTTRTARAAASRHSRRW